MNMLNGNQSDSHSDGEDTLFAVDDYEEINSRYFAEILKTGSWSALPAGWHNPHSDAASIFEACVPDKHGLQSYTLDEGDSLAAAKSPNFSVCSANGKTDRSITMR